MIILDECHHAASDSMLIEPIRYWFTSKDRAKEHDDDNLNAIFDIDTYMKVFQSDILLAKSEIILSRLAISLKKSKN